MPNCCLRYCKNNSTNTAKSKGITFHRFPHADRKNADKWMKFVRNNRNEIYWTPATHTYICSLHFLEEDTYSTKTGRRFLKKSAVPCKDPKANFELARKLLLEQENDKKVQSQNEKPKTRCESLTLLVKSLKTKFPIDRITENDLLAKAELVEMHKRFMKKTKQSRQSLQYTPALRKFALTLHYYLPAAYKYVRNNYNNVLPRSRTLCRWYGTTDAEPGFTNEAFEALKIKSKSSDKRLVCNLVFGEMSIHKQRLLHNQQNLGAVNFGAGPQEGDCDENLASQALVFMLVSLTEDWKLPVGYFLVAGTTAETKANLITTCLQKSHDAGVSVVSVTFDGCPANFSAAEILGCNLTDPENFVTHFLHPCTQEKVCIFLNPCHAIKFMRNSFEKKRLFIDEDGKKIRWQLLINLNKLQTKEGLRFGNKLTQRHLHLRNQIMKIKLATQLLSMSVANAMLLCDQELKSTQFQDSSATVNFLEIMNNFFDIMNSTTSHFCRFKRPIDDQNKYAVFDFLNQVKKYILNLKFHVKHKRVIKIKNVTSHVKYSILKPKVVQSANKTGFIGVIICLESLKTLYRNAVEEKKLMSYISTYRLSLDHLELFFGAVRKHGGYNNPNVLQFRAAYSKTLNHMDLRSSLTDNCIPLDNFNILHNSSIDVINSTTQMNRHVDEHYEILTATRCLESDMEAEKNCDIFVGMLSSEHIPFDSQLIVGYISGYISQILTKSLKCEDCVDSLSTSKRLTHHKLINIRDMGGLSYSTEDVYKICIATETVIRKLIRQSGGIGLSAEYYISYVTVNTLEYFIQKEVFTSLLLHSFNQPSTMNHRIHLIRAIINKYTTIRLRLEDKTGQTYDSSKL